MTQNLNTAQTAAELEVRNLTNVELIALVLGLEPDEHHVVERVLDDQPRGLGWLPASANTHAFHGLDLQPRHRHKLLAAIELSLRIQKGELRDLDLLDRSPAVANYLYMKYARTECLGIGALFLDLYHHRIDDRIFFQGKFDTCSFEPFPILAHALRISAPEIILFSLRTPQQFKANQKDTRCAHRLQQAAHVVGVKLLDYVLVGPSETHISLHRREELLSDEDLIALTDPIRQLT